MKHALRATGVVALALCACAPPAGAALLQRTAQPAVKAGSATRSMSAAAARAFRYGDLPANPRTYARDKAAAARTTRTHAGSPLAVMLAPASVRSWEGIRN